jgi:hypothetical protein
MAILSSSVPPPEAASAALSEEARWVAWKARGAREDMLVRRRLRVVLPMVAVAAIAAFYLVMVR